MSKTLYSNSAAMRPRLTTKISDWAIYSTEHPHHGRPSPVAHLDKEATAFNIIYNLGIIVYELHNEAIDWGVTLPLHVKIKHNGDTWKFVVDVKKSLVRAINLRTEEFFTLRDKPLFFPMMVLMRVVKGYDRLRHSLECAKRDTFAPLYDYIKKSYPHHRVSNEREAVEFIIATPGLMTTDMFRAFSLLRIETPHRSPAMHLVRIINESKNYD